jgi:large subunit ribosomal protein L4e
MYAPTKVWRKWHRKVNVNQRRYAICSALAASAVPALVMARGHKIDNVPEVPLVVATEKFNNMAKTKEALALLKTLGAGDDLKRVTDSKHLRPGKGKMRNRRFKQKLGPLVIFNEKGPLTRAFRNIPGVDLVCVTRLNLLKLAPGGHLGRFVVWTQDAFERLDSLYGSTSVKAAEKVDYHVPQNVVTNTDFSRIVNSVEIQTVLRAKKNKATGLVRKRNPLKNLGARLKLDPYTVVRRRNALLAAQKSKTDREATLKKKRAAKKAAKKYDTSVFRKRLLDA